MTPEPVHHVSSRLVKKEQRQLVLQTVWFVVLGIVILGVFVVVIMPNAIKFFFKFLDSNKGMDVSDQMPPQIPILAAPLDATSSASVALSGFAEADSSVVFVLNGSEISRVKAGADGTFTQDLRLDQGENGLEVYGVDGAGNESAKSITYQVYMDNLPVEIKVDEPAAGAQIEGRKNQNLTIKGMAKPDAKVYVNDRLNYAKADGSFSILYSLSEGENKLKIKVVDKAGNQAETELIVQFRF